MRLRRRKRAYWLSEVTIRLIRKKKRLYKKAKQSDTRGDLLRYRRVSNMVRRLTRRDHHDHLEEISRQLVGNQRIFWRWLKNVRGQSAGIPNLKYMGNILTAAVDKAEVFNHYFCSKHLKPASLEESLTGYMEHSIDCWRRIWCRRGLQSSVQDRSK